MPLFSTIIATRNRPALFLSALSSVVNQSCKSLEIIVVNDGSDEEHLAEYHRILGEAERPTQFHSLIRRPNGHGQSYALNFGVSQATGDYLCFLDDDDYWIDDSYLERVAANIRSREIPPDLVFSNQAAFFGEQQKKGPIWLEGLATKLSREHRRSDEDAFYEVSVDDLVNAGGFCHLNTMIVRSPLYNSAGGMDEGIRWECDHDLFLRLIDRAGTMLLSPVAVSRHNIPDPAKAASITTSLNEVQRRLFQLRVFEKASIFAASPEIRAHGRQHLGFTLKRIAQALVAAHDWSGAAYFGVLALAAAPTLKWAGYTTYVALARIRFGNGIQQ